MGSPLEIVYTQNSLDLRAADSAWQVRDVWLSHPRISKRYLLEGAANSDWFSSPLVSKQPGTYHSLHLKETRLFLSWLLDVGEKKGTQKQKSQGASTVRSVEEGVLVTFKKNKKTHVR